MPSSHKKVIIRTIGNELYSGYLPVSGLLETQWNAEVEGSGAGGAASFRKASPSVGLLDLEGRLQPIALDSIRSVAYVRDFNLNDRVDPERLTRRTFLARPRTEGLWVRLTFNGGDLLEGLAPIDLSLVDDLLHDRGIYLTPPDIRSNTQRLFIPRSAIADIQILAVITNPSKLKPAPAPAASPQDSLFPDMPPRR
jgi:hypothetical protein